MDFFALPFLHRSFLARNTNWYRSRTVLLALATVGTVGCTQDFQIRRVGPAPATAGVTEAGPAAAPLSAQQYREIFGHDAGSPDKRAARAEATKSLLTLYGDALLRAPGHVLRVPTAAGQTLTLTLHRGAGPGGANPSDYVALEPAGDFVVDRVDHPSRTSGEGVPVMGTLRAMMAVNSPGVVPAQPIPGAVRALTVVAGCSQRAASSITLELYDPRAASRPLSAEYTTAIALNLAHFRPQRRGLRGLLRGDDFSASGLYALETPTPDKTPLILVHGLISDPGDFYRLENDLAGSEEVRRHYQIWVFYYPTSLPVIYTSMLLHEDVDLFIHRLDPGGTHPALHRAVLIGHSMGGLLSRLAVSEHGERFYRHFFREPVDRLSLSAADRALVQRALLAPGTANVARVVFIATPHRGSSLASGPLGNLGRLLLHMPSAVQNQLQSVLGNNRQAVIGAHGIKPGSSLDSLTPGDPLIAAINDAPIRAGVHLHSIIGNRGQPGPVERSSDGVVPYTSSHLPQAESERIVPAGHTGTLLRPETSAEILRVLHP